MMLFILHQLAICITISVDGLSNIPARDGADTHYPPKVESNQTIVTSDLSSGINNTREQQEDSKSVIRGGKMYAAEDAWQVQLDEHSDNVSSSLEDYNNEVSNYSQLLTAEANELVTLKYDESGCWFPCFHFYEPICTMDMHVGVKTFWNFCVWLKYNWCHKTDYRFRHLGVCKPLRQRELAVLYSFTGKKYR